MVEEGAPDGGARWNRCKSRSGGTGLNQNVARGHRDTCDLEEKGESVVVRFISATHSALQNQRSAAGMPPSTANDGVRRRSGQQHREHRHLEGKTQVGTTPIFLK